MYFSWFTIYTKLAALTVVFTCMHACLHVVIPFADSVDLQKCGVPLPGASATSGQV